MCKQVRKRDGRLVEFDHSRIYAALQAAFRATGVACDYPFVCRVATSIQETPEDILDVEVIQDKVVDKLKSVYPNVAEQYKEYRHKRDMARKAKRNKVLEDIVEVKATDVTTENGNMNADTPSGMMYKFASEAAKEFACDNLIPAKFVEAHKSGEIHIHDLDYYPTRSLTCLQHPLNRILTEGFMAGHGESRPSKRIETASILGCISMETVQNEMHGGQAIPAFDFYLAPYVRRTYQEEIDKIALLLGRQLTHLYDTEIKDYIKQELPMHKGVKLSDKRIIQMAINATVDRVHQAMEAFIHNMNTIHSRGGNQVVFSSINYGTDTSAEGRCIIREVLKTTYQGVGNGKTAIFPIQIWKSKTGVSYKPGDPNYDLYEFACKVTAKRFFPNFLNLDATFNQHEQWKADDPERYLYEVATMGCLRKGTKVIMADGSLKEVQDVVVGEWLMGTEGPVQVQTLVRGTAPMYEISSKTGMTYAVNGKHLLHLKHCYPESRYGTNPGDEIDITVEDAINKSKTWFNCYLGYQIGYELPETDLPIDPYCLGLWLGDGIRTEPVLAVNKKEMQLADAWINYGKTLGLSHTLIEGHAGCFKVRITDHNKGSENGFMQKLYSCNLFKHKHIPEEYFHSSRNQRLKLLAGLLDTDGCFSSNRFQFSNANRELIDGVVRLAQSLGFHASISEVKSSSVIKGKQYNVQPCWNVGISGNVKELNKFTLVKKDTAVRHNCGTQSSIKIHSVGIEDYYGFVLSGNHLFLLEDGTVTHNCRTRILENRFGLKTSVGRGNLSFTTINLPRLGIELSIKYPYATVDERVKRLTKALLDKVDLVAEQLDERYKFQAQALKKQFPLLMSGLWNGSSMLSPEDKVEPVLSQGTLGIGFIGLAECLVALFGAHHGQSPEMQKIGLNLIKTMHEHVAELSVQYKHNYSVLATPAEGLSGRFTKIDRDIYGVIKGVTDRDFYTNSNHVPVYYKCTAKHKAEIECPYHEYTRGGHIFYVEQDGDPTHNPEAIMTIVDMLHYYNGGYASVNFNQNICYNCGFEWNGHETECPKCHSKSIDTLQRITGYLVGSTKRWNKGKLAELRERTTHEV